MSAKRIKEIEERLRSLKYEKEALERELTDIKDHCRHGRDGATLGAGKWSFCSICGKYVDTRW